VSVDDTQAWAKLKAIAVATGLPWPLADEMLNTDSPEQSEVISNALRRVKDLWNREDARQRRAGKDGAKPLPRMDVCLRVKVMQGNQGLWPGEIYGALGYSREGEMLLWRH